MDNPRQIINQFLSGSHKPEDLKSELFRAAEAAEQTGMTFMEATFQLGDKAKSEGLSEEDSDATIRRAFAAEKRSREREAAPEDHAAPAEAEGQARASSAPAQGIVHPIISNAISLEQVLSMGLDAQALELLQNHRIDPEALNIPWPTPDWRLDFVKLLKALFRPEETVEYKKSNTPDATSITVSDVLNDSENIKKTMKSLDGKDGALVSINAVRGDESDESFRFRYAVIDNPKISLAKQLAYYKALNLPCAALVSTGSNSVQAWIKINAKSRDEYDTRVEYLFKTLDEQGFKVDSTNANPAQMVRMPGVLRNGKQQYLIGLDQGAKSFEDWQTWVEFCLDGKPLVELASDSDNAPKRDNLIIDGALRTGEFMLLSAPPKSGKSLSLIDLALSVSHGEDWFGFATRQTDVLFVTLESTRSAFLNRLFDVAEARRLSAATPSLGFLTLRGIAFSPLEMAQYIAKRVKGAKQLEDHNYELIVIDPISAILHNPKALRSSSTTERSLLQMVDMLLALTGSAVVTATDLDEMPELSRHADSILSLSPVDGCPDIYSLKGTFREFPARPSSEVSWRYPRFIL